MDPRRALLLQVEWGADEALDSRPHSHLGVIRPAAAVRALARPDPVAPTARPSAATGPAVSDLAGVVAALAAFDGAGLAATATHLVPPIGPACGLMILGEAPGAAEDRAGEAFVGPEGQLLRRMLGSIGIDPRHALLAYLVPWRPPGGRAPSATELSACEPFLRLLLAATRPRVLLALGSGPAKTLLGAAARRGRWTELGPEILGEAWLDPPLPVLPTGNPAVLLKQPRQKAAAWAEMRMLRRKIEKLPNL